MRQGDVWKNRRCVESLPLSLWCDKLICAMLNLSLSLNLSTLLMCWISWLIPCYVLNLPTLSLGYGWIDLQMNWFVMCWISLSLYEDLTSPMATVLGSMQVTSGQVSSRVGPNKRSPFFHSFLFLKTSPSVVVPAVEAHVYYYRFQNPTVMSLLNQQCLLDLYRWAPHFIH